jgi:radical SAM superfamily enzyme YgiQ (UPF0313 family)
VNNNNSCISLWLCDLTHDRQTIALNNIPYAIGMLASYVNANLPGRFDIKLFKFPDSLIEAFQREQPRVVGFSNYIWHKDLSYGLAKEIKRLSPSTVVIFGGPDFPYKLKGRHGFLSQRDKIDFYIFGEGEDAFCRLLTSLIQNDFDISKTKALKHFNTCSINNDNLVTGDIAPRIDLNAVPSPYLEGILDGFFTKKMMPLIQTNRGCPFTCTYCTEGTDSYSKVTFVDVERINKELEYIAEKRMSSQNLNIADSNFGMYQRDIEISYGIAKIQETYKWPKYIHVAVGKNQKKRVLQIAKIIKGALRLSATVQSTDSQVLENIKRKNISIEEIIEVAKEGNSIGSNTYAELIIALPGDTKEAHFKGIEQLANTGLKIIYIYTLMMLKGAEIASSENRKKYGMVTKFRVLPRCFGSYRLGDTHLNSIEVEEVCVANNTLSFQDYLDCRVFSLVLELFYNDSILKELINLIKNMGIKPYAFLKAIYDSVNSLPGSLKEMFSTYRKDTINDLWDSEEEVYKFARSVEGIKKYVSGEYGTNLSYKYKALGINYLEEIHEVGFNAASGLINQHVKDTDKDVFSEFLQELKLFSILRKKNMFKADESYTGLFHFDLGLLQSGRFTNPLKELRREKPIKVMICHSPEQREIINNAIKEFSSDLIGITQIFSRINIKKLYRKVEPAAI